MVGFEITDNGFRFEGEPFQILSGAIHYFRVFPECWEDRLQKLKMCGFNTVETYVPWNMHEPEQGGFCFEGMLDLVAFVKKADAMNLKVIVRPSPYICAEWEFGGLPAWLLADPGMRLRCAYPPFLRGVDGWFDAVLPKLVPLQVTRGGPILAMQIENEYGSYGNDKAYLQHLQQGMISRGVDVPLFTSDGPEDLMLSGGTLPGVFKTVNFGSRPSEAFVKLREWQAEGPLMCMEYWNGWFDHWGKPHHTRDATDAAGVLDEMLKMDASVNFYMFHGGTNFGFMNGANRQERYEPTVTSYDYDAPLGECGDASEKWYKVRDVMSRHVPVDMSWQPPVSAKQTYGEVAMSEASPLLESLDSLSKSVDSAFPEPMECFGQGTGFILYRTVLPHLAGARTLKLRGVHDRAQVFLNGTAVGIMERDVTPETLTLMLTGKNDVLEILVENMGRVNYGEDLADRKGIVDGIRLDHQYLFGWTVYPLPLADVSGLAFVPAGPDAGVLNGKPSFFRGCFHVEKPADTFLSLEGWTKGVAWVNGFNLGRYWNRGPTKTLYVPAPLLCAGENHLVVLELEETLAPVAHLLDHPQLG